MFIRPVHFLHYRRVAEVISVQAEHCFSEASYLGAFAVDIYIS
ncbi:hypothetical protein [Agarivorans sp. B2Z047]|nr:hypothetical protein [Agarivorans sp. B2Z047]